MPSWTKILEEIGKQGSTQDSIRRKYLKKLAQLTKRNTVAYYSGFLQKRSAPGISINDNDKNGFINAIGGLNPLSGLDLILHTPGGEVAATESLGDYLRSQFGKNIRVIVPQLAMSGGTLLACLGKEIIMGKQSNLGPIDPQIGGLPAHGIIEEFQEAINEVSMDPRKAPIWQVVISKYSPTLIGECKKGIKWSEDIARQWLEHGMFSKDRNKTRKIDNILKELASHALTLSHARHLSIEKCKKLGFRITYLEDDLELQEAVLSVHHAFMISFDTTPATKIIENQNGVAYIQTLQTLITQ